VIGSEIGFVAQAGRASTDAVEGIAAKLRAAGGSEVGDSKKARDSDEIAAVGPAKHYGVTTTDGCVCADGGSMVEIG
jgi:hypothetical protein